MIVTEEVIPKLRGDLIELFQLRQSDVSAPYLGWLSNQDVTQYLEVRFAISQRDQLISYVEPCLASPNIVLLDIRTKAEGKHVGSIKLAWSPNHLIGDIGIMLGDRATWGRGYMQLISRLALDTLKLRKLVAGIYRSNAASIRAFQKAGFQQDAVLRGHALLDQRPEDVLLCATFQT